MLVGLAYVASCNHIKATFQPWKGGTQNIQCGAYLVGRKIHEQPLQDGQDRFPAVRHPCRPVRGKRGSGDGYMTFRIGKIPAPLLHDSRQIHMHPAGKAVVKPPGAGVKAASQNNHRTAGMGCQKTGDDPVEVPRAHGDTELAQPGAPVFFPNPFQRVQDAYSIGILDQTVPALRFLRPCPYGDKERLGYSVCFRVLFSIFSHNRSRNN